MPARDDQLELAAGAAEPDAVDRRILRRDLDRDRIDVGRGRSRRRPQPQRGEGEQAGAGAEIERDWRLAAPAALSRSSATRQPVVVSCWPVPKARPASISKAIAPGGTCVAVRGRVDEEAAGADRLQPGLAQASPNPRRRAAPPPARRRAALGASAASRSRSAGPARPRNRRPSASAVAVRLAGHQHRRRIERGELGDILLQRLRLGPGAGQGDLPAVSHDRSPAKAGPSRAPELGPGLRRDSQRVSGQSSLR